MKYIDQSGPCQDLSNLEIVSFLLCTFSCTLTEGTDLLYGPSNSYRKSKLPQRPQNVYMQRHGFKSTRNNMQLK